MDYYLEESRFHQNFYHKQTNPKINYNFHSKILLLGSGRVGKTSALYQFIFKQDYNPFQSIHKLRQSYLLDCKLLQNYRASVEFVDSLSLNEISQLMYFDATGFLLFFSYSDPKSFEELKQWLLKIDKFNKMHAISLILIGNKCDINDPFIKGVSEKEVQEFCEQQSLKYLNTSVKAKVNIEEAFREIIAQTFMINKTFQEIVKMKIIFLIGGAMYRAGTIRTFARSALLSEILILYEGVNQLVQFN